MDKQVTIFWPSQTEGNKSKMVREAYKSIAISVRRVSLHLKCLRMYLEKVAPQGPNFELKPKVQELLQSILSSCKNEYFSKIHCPRVMRLFKM